MADSGGWTTIESDEVPLIPLQSERSAANIQQGLFTSLIETLGVKDTQFEELISLDADTIRSLGYVHPQSPPPNQTNTTQLRLRRNLPLQMDPRSSRRPRRSAS